MVDVKLERADAMELHEAVAPWESKTAPYLPFVLILGLSAVLGTVMGSLFDNFVEWAQGSDPQPPRSSCAQWFFIQIWMNITALYILNHIIKWGFVPWLLITLAGFLFTLTLVNVQNSLTDNALCLFKF
jgi:hypothetical protein